MIIAMTWVLACILISLIGGFVMGVSLVIPSRDYGRYGRSSSRGRYD